MNRPIKFRVWGKTEKEYIRYPFAWLSLFDSPDGLEIEENEDLVIEQYIGLTDKNDKEIYEGDIVKCQRPAFHMKTVKETNNCTVRFNDGLFAFYNEKGKLYCDCIHNMTERKDVEIIGNIHKNQELLEVEE